VTNTSLPGLPHLNGRRSAGAMLTSSDFLLCQCQLAQNGQLPVGTLISRGGVAEVDEFLRTPCHTTGSMGYLFKHHIELQLFEHSTDFFKDDFSDGFHFPTWRESVPCGVTLPSPGYVSHVNMIDT